MTLHPEILIKDGKKQFAVLPYEEFVSLKERLEDMEDLLELRRAKKGEGRKRTVPLARAKRPLELR
ncbi:MAG: type II toxin-antitoxin system Phd/YefM family antitoxin [Nitrospirota bacterium]